MKTKELKADFETWYFAQFGNGIGLDFIENSRDCGYVCEQVNALWIGFCAGRLTACENVTLQIKAR